MPSLQDVILVHSRATCDRMCDEAFIFEIAYRKIKGSTPVGTGNSREPAPVVVAWVFTDAPDISPHREAQRIGVDTRIPLATVRPLQDNVGMRMQEFEHKTVGQPPFVVEGIEQSKMPEAGPRYSPKSA